MHDLMAHGKSLPPHITGYIREWIETEWIAKGHKQTELAKICDVDKATITDLKKGRRGAGWSVFEGVAKAHGITKDELERQALAWWKEHGDKAMDTADPHPNRAAALEFLRADIPAEVAKRIRSVTLDTAGDPSRAWWVQRIMSELDLFRVQNP